MIDVDDFKRINDELGHAVGDEALWHTADILRGVFGKDPVFLARYGGDEFAVLGDWFGQEQIEEAIARIQEGIERFNKEGQLPLQLSMSIGYAFWHEAGRRGENLIQQATQKLGETLLKELEEQRKRLREFRPVSPFEWKDADKDIRYYDDPIDGKVEIPADAPPRSSDEAIWNVLSQKWVDTDGQRSGS